MAQVPIGLIVAWATNATPPVGYLLCNGSAVSRGTYSLLFAAIGTTNGAGDGSSTFNLPSYPGRIPFGAGIGQAPGQAGGSRTWNAPSHDHAPQQDHTSLVSATTHNHADDNPLSGINEWSQTTGAGAATRTALIPSAPTYDRDVYSGASHTHDITDGTVGQDELLAGSAEYLPESGGIQKGHVHGTSGRWGAASGGPDQMPVWFATNFIIRAA